MIMIMTIIGILTSICTITGLSAMKIFSKNKPMPRFVKITERIICKENVSGKLKITYDDELINSDISITTLTFWNEGNKKIKKSYYPDNIPPAIISVPDVKILDCDDVDVYHKDFININLLKRETDNKQCFTFETIGRKQGVTFRIVHTGNNNNDINLDVSLNDLKLKKINIYSNPKEKLWDRVWRPVGWFFLISFSLVCFLWVYALGILGGLIWFGICFAISVYCFIHETILCISPMRKIPKIFRKRYYSSSSKKLSKKSLKSLE